MIACELCVVQLSAKDFVPVHPGEDGETGSGCTGQQKLLLIQQILSHKTSNYFALLMFFFSYLCRSLKRRVHLTWPRGPCSCWRRCPGREACSRRSSRRRAPPAREFPDRFAHSLPTILFLFFCIRCVINACTVILSMFSLFHCSWSLSGI